MRACGGARGVSPRRTAAPATAMAAASAGDRGRGAGAGNPAGGAAGISRMLVAITAGPRAAFSISLFTLLVASLVTAAQPPMHGLVTAAGSYPVRSVRPGPPAVQVTDQHGLVIDGAQVRYHGLVVGRVADVVTDRTTLVEVLRADAAAGQRDPMAGVWALTVRCAADAPRDAIDAVAAAAREAGFDRIDEVPLEGHLHWIVDGAALAIDELAAPTGVDAQRWR